MGTGGREVEGIGQVGVPRKIFSLKHRACLGGVAHKSHQYKQLRITMLTAPLVERPITGFG